MSIRGVIIEPARLEDDAALRRILRLSPLPGWVSMSHECEPSLHDALRASGADVEIIVARREADGRVLGFFSRQSRCIFFNGRERRLGYMGQLRFDPSVRARLAILRAGFACWREHMHARAQLPWDITSILADNMAARRLLEAGVRGFPDYIPLCDYETLAIATSADRAAQRDKAISPAHEEDLPGIRLFIREIFRGLQFAPALPESEWRRLFSMGSLKAGDFLIFREDGTMRGVLAIWDQRAHKQTVIRSYAPSVRFIRPLINPFLPLAGMPALPAPGETLQQATLSFIAIQPRGRADILPRLIRAARARAARNGLKVLIMGWAADNPMAEIVKRHFRCLEYRSRLYLVRPARSGGAERGGHDMPQPSRVHQEVCFL